MQAGLDWKLESVALQGTVISESNEADIGSFRGMCGLDSGVDMFGQGGGTGSRRGGRRDLLSYYDDVPAWSRCTGVWTAGFVESKTTQGPSSRLRAWVTLVDSFFTGVARRRCDFI